MRRFLCVAVIAFVVSCVPVSSHAQCGFHIEREAGVTWFRSGGWSLPGLKDVTAINEVAKPSCVAGGGSLRWPDGVTAWSIQHRKEYRISFPDAVFEEDGIRKNMRSSGFVLLALWRWDMNGRTYAYSYRLLPSPSPGTYAMCDSAVEIIDDKGDGIFRVMSPIDPYSGFTPPAVPAWVSKPKL
jgi:hypothetical protein